MIAMFLVPSIIDLIGAKWSMVIGSSCYVLFLAGFLHLTTWLLYLLSAIIGFGASRQLFSCFCFDGYSLHKYVSFFTAVIFFDSKLCHHFVHFMKSKWLLFAHFFNCFQLKFRQCHWFCLNTLFWSYFVQFSVMDWSRELSHAQFNQRHGWTEQWNFVGNESSLVRELWSI
jgi:hypothetical protein